MAKKLQATIQTKDYDISPKPESTLKPKASTPAMTTGGSVKSQLSEKAKSKRGGHPAGMMIRGSKY